MEAQAAIMTPSRLDVARVVDPSPPSVVHTDTLVTSDPASPSKFSSPNTSYAASSRSYSRHSRISIASISSRAPFQSFSSNGISPRIPLESDTVLEVGDDADEDYAPDLSSYSMLNSSRMRNMFSRNGLPVPSEPVSESEQRRKMRCLDRPARVRVNWICHECSSPFGKDRICHSCGHSRCSDCDQHAPVKQDLPSKALYHSVETKATAPVDVDDQRVQLAQDSHVVIDSRQNTSSEPQQIDEAYNEDQSSTLVASILSQSNSLDDDVSEPATLPETIISKPLLDSFCDACPSYPSDKVAPGITTAGLSRSNQSLVADETFADDPPDIPTDYPSTFTLLHQLRSRSRNLRRPASQISDSTCQDSDMATADRSNRVFRAPRVRVKYLCERCETPFNQSNICSECSHRRCASCLKQSSKHSSGMNYTELRRHAVFGTALAPG